MGVHPAGISWIQGEEASVEGPLPHLHWICKGDVVTHQGAGDVLVSPPPFLQGVEEVGAAIHLPKEVDAGLNEGTPSPIFIEGLEFLWLLLAHSADGWIPGAGGQMPLQLQDMPFQLLYHCISLPAGPQE